MLMGIRWWWWALGAVVCILLGTIWAALSNPAVFYGLRASASNFGEWVETHHGAITLLATLFIAALQAPFGGPRVSCGRRVSSRSRLRSRHLKRPKRCWVKPARSSVLT